MTGERGVSTVAGYVMNVVVATLLITALLAAIGTHLQDREEQVVRSGLRVVGERTVANLLAADRLVVAGSAGSAPSVSVRVPLPERIAGHSYRVTVDPAPDPHLVLRTDDPAVTVRVPFRTTTPVAAVTVNGGDLVIRTSGGQLVVSDDP